MKQTILARHPRDLNVAWAQKIINQHVTDTIVSDIDIVSVDIGTTTRVRVAVRHNGPDTLPKRWFVKLPSLSWQARMITTLPRLLHNEVRFYQEVNHSAPLTIPTCLAAQSRPGLGSTLVLADVTENQSIAGHPRDALTVEQAPLVIEQLALFHSRFWDNSQLKQNYPWLAGPVRQLEDRLGTLLAMPLMKHGLKQAGTLIPAKLHQSALRYARYRRKAMAFLSQIPQTLIHHDCHPGNLFWNASRPGLLDWQLVRIGEGISDVAYFLATALEPETRRRHEADLLAVYTRTLANNGIAVPDNDHLMQRYRAHLVYPFEAMVLTLAVGGMMNLESNLELIRRTAAAVDDLDAFSALPIL